MIVATTAVPAATRMLAQNELRTWSLWNASSYQPVVNPLSGKETLAESLNEKMISITVGR